MTKWYHASRIVTHKSGIYYEEKIEDSGNPSIWNSQ